MTRRDFLWILGLTGCYKEEIISPSIETDSTAMKKQIIGFWDSGPSYDTDAQSFFTAAGITDATQKSAVNTMVVALKAASLWTGIKAIYPYVGGTADTTKYNLKDPRDLNAAYRITWSGGITYDSTGVTFNGTTGGGDTNLNALSVFGTNYIGMHTYCRSQSNTGIWMAAGSINFDWSGGAGGAVINNGNAAAVSVTGRTSGMSSVVRADATNALQVYEGDNLGNKANVFTANANANFLLGRHSSGLYSNGNISFQAITDNMTAAQCLTFNNIVFEFLVTLGRASRQVIFTGDSITAGVGASPSSNRWSLLFATNKSLTETNNAVNSTPLESAVTVITNNLYDTRTTRIPFKTAQRKYLLICHAVNDCGYNTGNYTTTLFNSQYQTIITLALTRGWSTSNIFIVAGFYVSPAAWTNPWGGITVTPADDTRYQSFVNEANTIATTNGLTFIDIRGVYSGSGTDDGLHPNNAGHLAISNYVTSIIP